MEMQEIQAKAKQNVAMQGRFRKLKLPKYTMDDLSEHLSRQNANERDWRLKCFDELYACMLEMKQMEMRPTSSIQDPTSPRESESMASMTPTGEYGRARGQFFRD